ncbi:hypothetical protein G6O69_03735 [Pseudenhygromyxa sp. WMMC2535]|uniref:transketolase C-terminal domain-containing protein n=1 Tax=Pseudenhygromyxa sp. WMMC2535 TaxID=2712867 RepID=UPI001557DD46|nr:transketolase C-terminal domain-containing protein [Pseudenhygromyxa sp. WMMC2535]NVB36927.1 hypothetical protein [Pseudenhygromyxa sp. WMMC2535]
MSALVPLARTVAALLREDDRRCLLGEDVRNGGLLGLSRAAAEDERLRPRLLGGPLTGAGQLIHAGGLALSGLRPIVLLPSAAALLEGMAALRELGRLSWRSGGDAPEDQSERAGVELPLLFVAPNGPGFGLGGEAAESVESALAAIPGLELWSAGRATQLCAYLRSAAETRPFAGPRVLLLPRAEVVSDLDVDVDLHAGLDRPLTATLRRGDRATVFAWGAALEPALAAAEALASAEQLEVEVVEVGRLSPLDEDVLVEAAARTGKLVIAHAGPRRHGLGAELAALFADRAILHLDAPVLRVTGEGALVAGHEDALACPSAAAIAQALVDVIDY